MQNESLRDLDWRGWIDRYLELVQWDLDLTAAGEMGLHESLRGLFPDMRREFAAFMSHGVSRRGCANLEGDRPPLSIDIVGEFLLPVLQAGPRGGVHRRSTACGSISGGCSSR